MARERRMYEREQRTLKLLDERGAITASELAEDLGMDRYRAYVWLRGVAGNGFLYQSPDGHFSLSCPLPSADAQLTAA